MILHFINTVILKLHKDKIEKGLIFLNRISVNKINKIIMKLLLRLKEEKRYIL